jgi:hypothetical protein
MTAAWGPATHIRQAPRPTCADRRSPRRRRRWSRLLAVGMPLVLVAALAPRALADDGAPATSAETSEVGTFEAQTLATPAAPHVADTGGDANAFQIASVEGGEDAGTSGLLTGEEQLQRIQAPPMVAEAGPASEQQRDPQPDAAVGRSGPTGEEATVVPDGTDQAERPAPAWPDDQLSADDEQCADGPCSRDVDLIAAAAGGGGGRLSRGLARIRQAVGEWWARSGERLDAINAEERARAEAAREPSPGRQGLDRQIANDMRTVNDMHNLLIGIFMPDASGRERIGRSRAAEARRHLAEGRQSYNRLEGRLEELDEVDRQWYRQVKYEFDQTEQRLRQAVENQERYERGEYPMSMVGPGELAAVPGFRPASPPPDLTGYDSGPPSVPLDLPRFRPPPTPPELLVTPANPRGLPDQTVLVPPAVQPPNPVFIPPTVDQRPLASQQEETRQTSDTWERINKAGHTTRYFALGAIGAGIAYTLWLLHGATVGLAGALLPPELRTNNPLAPPRPTQG